MSVRVGGQRVGPWRWWVVVVPLRVMDYPEISQIAPSGRLMWKVEVLMGLVALVVVVVRVMGARSR